MAAGRVGAPARILEHADTTLDLAVIAVPDLTKLRAPPLAWQALPARMRSRRGPRSSRSATRLAISGLGHNSLI